MLNIAELATAAQYNLPVIVCVFNNQGYGVLRYIQSARFDGRETGVDLATPDFVKVAEAYGLPGLRVTRKEEVVSAIEQAMAHEGPFLIEFLIEPEENVFPMVPPGASLAEVIEGPKKEVLTWPRRSTP